MIAFAPANDLACIAVPVILRQFWAVTQKNHDRRNGMKTTTVQNKLTRGMTITITTVAMVFAASAQGQSLAKERPSKQQSSNEQCSLAVVSRQVESGKSVCDSPVVQEMARRGHAFEQNQLGIASILAIGPDYSEKEAMAWFERAAQRGYAPAEVNLAVMYINGWGTPVNYGAALHWLQAAASQGFARAYYNLGHLYLEGTGVRQDKGEAFRWFQKGAEGGDSSAQ